MRYQTGLSTCVLFPTIVLVLSLLHTSVSAQPIAIASHAFKVAPVGESIVGIASFYDEAGPTASGEPYDPTAFTAAALMELRDKFGGIEFGRLYRPAYGIAEYNGKRAILKFNDVGPLKPGRKFDLSRAAMEHFGGIEKGLLSDFKVTLLPPGEVYTAGPLVDDQLRPFDGDREQIILVDMIAPAGADKEPDTSIGEALMEATTQKIGPVPCDANAVSHTVSAIVEAAVRDQAEKPAI